MTMGGVTRQALAAVACCAVGLQLQLLRHTPLIQTVLRTSCMHVSALLLLCPCRGL
jgi:hypothetical protein